MSPPVSHNGLLFKKYTDSTFIDHLLWVFGHCSGTGNTVENKTKVKTGGLAVISALGQLKWNRGGG